MLVERAFPIWLRDVPPTNLGYMEQSGYFANHAWRLTGEIRYAELMEERFKPGPLRILRRAGQTSRCLGHSRGPHRGSNNSFNFLETAYYGMDLLAATEGKRGHYVEADTGPKCQAVEIHFAKDRHEPLRFDLRFRPGYDMQVTWTPTGYGRPTRDTMVGPVRWDSQIDYFTKDAPGLGGGFASVELGAETVEGEYRFLEVPHVFKSNARRLVLVARRHPPARHPRPAARVALPHSRGQGGRGLRQQTHLPRDRRQGHRLPGRRLARVERQPTSIRWRRSAPAASCLSPSVAASRRCWPSTIPAATSCRASSRRKCRRARPPSSCRRTTNTSMDSSAGRGSTPATDPSRSRGESRSATASTNTSTIAKAPSSSGSSPGKAPGWERRPRRSTSSPAESGRSP